MKKLVSMLFTLCLMLAVCAFSSADAAFFDGGTGTADDPFRIAAAEQLLILAETVNDGSTQGYPGAFFVLTEDIDLADTKWQPIGHMDLSDMSNTSCMFFGTFNGQGHTISNVTFAATDPICGVGVIGMNCGEVKNLTVKNAIISAEDTFSMAIGGVVGYNMGSVHDVTLTGENVIAGVNCTGGIVGGNMGEVFNCSVENTTIRVLGDNDFSSGRIIQADVAECGGLIIGGSFGGTIDGCTAQGKVIAEGNEPVGLGGIAGCLEMMDSVTNCTADAEIVTTQGGHAIGGLCGFSGTHSNGGIVAETEGLVTTVYPGMIDSCAVTVKMNVPGTTHVGGLVGTGLYYYGEETAFRIENCAVNGEIINGEITETEMPGAVAGRAVNSVIESCEANVTLNGELLTEEIGKTATMYESADQLEEEADDGAQLLEDVKGTYVALFPVITAPEYDSLWLDPCAAIVGEEAAPEVAEMLKAACNGTIYGQEAMDAFGDGSNGAQFDCLFIHGVDQITFDGATISGTSGGKEVFSHEYAYVGPLSLSGMMDGFLYETADADAGEFRYFFMMSDTPATTYHLEFRYGSDMEALTQYNEGSYAYWLAAGFPVDADEKMVKNVITLFCLENMDYSAHAASALTQLKDLGFVGTWQADMTPFGEDYARVNLNMTIDENGHGVTMMNGEQTADFEAYAVDNGEKGDGIGLYVAFSNPEGEAEAAPYTLSVNETGQTVLTLTAEDGVICWVRSAETESSSKRIEIATAKELAAIQNNLSGQYILTADIDLSAYENWEPIGAFKSLSDAPEDAEIPHPGYAFTGSFDGNGHKISNLTVMSNAPIGAGLFACASGTEQSEGYIGNFTLENVNVTGGYLVGGAVGLQFMGCKISDITLEGENQLTGMQGIGGIVGTGFDLISNCSATADITAVGSEGACAGLIAGGTTMSSIENCQAIGGSITAEGDAAWGFGAICGAPWGAPEIKDCTASGTIIRVTGKGNRLVGGLLGFAGTYDPENPAQISGCKVENVTIEVSDSTDSVGGLVGAGKEMTEGSEVMSSFAVTDCFVSGTIIGGGEYVDTVAGDPACAVAIACEGGMTIQ